MYSTAAQKVPHYYHPVYTSYKVLLDFVLCSAVCMEAVRERNNHMGREGKVRSIPL